MKIAVIPARGGSKRIPRKNIKNFSGKPLIVWAIETALRAGVFEKIIVSTDDAQIARIAQEAGAEVPFMRPAALATDEAGTMDVMQHAAKYLLKNSKAITHICCIYPTAALMTSEDITESLDVLVGEDLNYVFSASTFDYPIQRAIKSVGRDVQMFQPEFVNTRSQDLQEAVHDAGQFYWGTIESWRTKQEVFSKNCKVHMMPRYRSIDIDTNEDWILAQMIHSSLYKKV